MRRNKSGSSNIVIFLFIQIAIVIVMFVFGDIFLIWDNPWIGRYFSQSKFIYFISYSYAGELIRLVVRMIMVDSIYWFFREKLFFNNKKFSEKRYLVWPIILNIVLVIVSLILFIKYDGMAILNFFDFGWLLCFSIVFLFARFFNRFFLCFLEKKFSSSKANVWAFFIIVLSLLTF